jgi:ribosomal protein L6P/L9E
VSPLPLLLSNLLPCYNSGVIKLTSLSSNVYYKTYLEQLNYLVAAFFKPYFAKIKFRGKGYYIYKNTRNTIAPQFGYSHRVYVYSFFSKVKFIGKTKVILFGLVKDDVLATSHILKSKRPINIFTGRGVRFAKQIVYKKQGKVSSYR